MRQRDDLGQGARLVITCVDDMCILGFFINSIPGRGSVVKPSLLWYDTERGLMKGIRRIFFVFLSRVRNGTSIVPITTATVVETSSTYKSPLLTADIGNLLGHMTHHHTSLSVKFQRPTSDILGDSLLWCLFTSTNTVEADVQLDRKPEEALLFDATARLE